MRRVADRAMMLAALGCVAGALLLGLASGLRATPEDGNAPQKAKAKAPQGGGDTPGKGPTKETAGDLATSILGCELCHAGATNPTVGKIVSIFKSKDFILLDESVTWVQADVHSAATKNLSGALGKQMSANLKYNVEESPLCLTCHSTDKSPRKPLAEKKYKDFTAGDLIPTDTGVNCTACHGMHKNWQTEHYEKPNVWRPQMPAAKYERGMVDLRNPVVKAKLCASCHIGNASEGKVVTHDMYAAGHPPLPPLELASYMEGQPKHWAYPTDPRLKYFAVTGRDIPKEDEWQKLTKDEIWPKFHYHLETDESYLSRHYAAGAIAALRAEAEVLLGDAEANLKGGDGMDFARFDCYACHHDLQYPSERQKRGYDGPPGRPTLRAATGIPATLVAKHAEGIEAGGLKAKALGFEEKWSALRKAATVRPFGDPAKMKDAAKGVMDWCDAFLTVQGDAPVPLYTPAQAKLLRDRIAATATSPAALADPEVAMSLAWGYTTLAKEAKVVFPESKLTALGSAITLNVRNAPFSRGKSPDITPVGAQFPPRMRAVNAFEAAAFRSAFNGLLSK